MYGQTKYHGYVYNTSNYVMNNAMTAIKNSHNSHIENTYTGWPNEHRVTLGKWNLPFWCKRHQKLLCSKLWYGIKSWIN